MTLYQIIFHNDLASSKRTDAVNIVNLYASNPINASTIFVDLAFNDTEPYREHIRTWLLFMMTHICDDGIDVMEHHKVVDSDGYSFNIWGTVQSKKDPVIVHMKSEYDDIYAYYLHSDYREKEEDKFLLNNKENFKLLLEKYLDQLDAYIRIVPLRISNQPTLTKPAK